MENVMQRSLKSSARGEHGDQTSRASDPEHTGHGVRERLLRNTCEGSSSALLVFVHVDIKFKSVESDLCHVKLFCADSDSCLGH